MLVADAGENLNALSSIALAVRLPRMEFLEAAECERTASSSAHLVVEGKQARKPDCRAPRLDPGLQLARCRIVSRFERGDERRRLGDPPQHRFSQCGFARRPLMDEPASDERAPQSTVREESVDEAPLALARSGIVRDVSMHTGEMMESRDHGELATFPSHHASRQLARVNVRAREPRNSGAERAARSCICEWVGGERAPRVHHAPAWPCFTVPTCRRVSYVMNLVDDHDVVVRTIPRPWRVRLSRSNETKSATVPVVVSASRHNRPSAAGATIRMCGIGATPLLPQTSAHPYSSERSAPPNSSERCFYSSDRGLLMRLQRVATQATHD